MIVAKNIFQNPLPRHTNSGLSLAKPSIVRCSNTDSNSISMTFLNFESPFDQSGAVIKTIVSTNR